MYRVVKEVGTAENVYLQNTDTMAEINLGRMTPTILHILEEDGYKFGDLDKEITMKEKWNLHITEETKDKLRKLAMPMSKPVRDQRKNKEDKPKEEKKIVDVLDIIYGLA